MLSVDIPIFFLSPSAIHAVLSLPIRRYPTARLAFKLSVLSVLVISLVMCKECMGRVQADRQVGRLTGRQPVQSFHLAWMK